MTREDAARIERANAERNKGQTPPNSFPSRAKRAAEENDKVDKPKSSDSK